TASSSVSFTGATTVKASPTNPGAIDFSQLSDVTASFTVSYARTSFNHGTNVLYADFTATDAGNYTVGTPLLVGVRHISAPSVRVVAGQTYNYTASAADPDGDYLEFSTVAGPANLVFTDAHAGTLTWTTATTDIGTYPIRLRVSDNNGGTADQTFILSVVAS